MGYDVIASKTFQRVSKRLVKKYPSLKKELLDLVERLKDNPKLGTSLGNNIYKIRLSIASKGKGKSGGSRVITYVRTEGKTVYLMTMFDKSEEDNISDKELRDLLREIGE